MIKEFSILDRKIGEGHPCYIIAEVSCNHEGDFNEARRIIETAAICGADAVKLQTYTADTISRNFGTRPKGTIWESIDLYKLYNKAHTPWSWTTDLMKVAADNGLALFSSPFDETAVDFLMEAGVPAMKIASFEVVDTKLIEKIARTGLPVIMSNGMTDFMELNEAVDVLRRAGCREYALLHCNSGYPAAFAEANLSTMEVMEGIYGCPVGLSDHTLFSDHENYAGPLAHVTPVEAVKMGAKIIELHLMLDRAAARQLFKRGEGGFDWPFSREPAELKKMVEMIRTFEKTGTVDYDTAEEREVALRTHGKVCFDPTEKELKSRNLRPSLWVVKDIEAGKPFIFGAEDKSAGNFDSVRPAGGLHVRFTDFIEGKRATRNIKAGEPLAWDMIDTGGRRAC